MTNKYFLAGTDTTVIRDIAGKYSYKFDIESKFTIICGNSGTGKTTLCSLLERPVYDVSCFMRNPRLQATCDYDDPHAFCTIYSQYRFITLTTADARNKRFSGLSWADWINSMSDEDTVVCIDEDFTSLYSVEFQKALLKTSAKYLIICRAPLSSIPYGISDVKEIVTDPGTGVHYFKSLVDKYCNKILFRSAHDIKFDDYSCLVVEDSKSDVNLFMDLF